MKSWFRRKLNWPIKKLRTPTWHAILRQPIRPVSCGMVAMITGTPPLTPFSIFDIYLMYAASGKRDPDRLLNQEFIKQENWVGLFRLRDIRYVCIRGVYDPENGEAGATEAQASYYLEELVRFGLTENERRLLNLLLPEETSHKT